MGAAAWASVDETALIRRRGGDAVTGGRLQRVSGLCWGRGGLQRKGGARLDRPGCMQHGDVINAGREPAADPRNPTGAQFGR